MQRPQPEDLSRVIRSFTPNVPFHVQIREQLRSAIADGTLPEDAQLPSEQALSEAYEVSRMTARQALSALVAEGLLRRVHGRGTFVTPPKVRRDMTRLQSLHEELTGLGHTVVTRLIAANEVQADSDLASALQVKEGSAVFVLKRLRLADCSPIALHVNHVPKRLCPQLLAETGGELESLYRYLESSGVVIKNGSQTLEAMVATRSLADLLEVRRGAPILRLQRVSFDPENRPVEMSYACYRGDRYTFGVRLERW